jgi:hypothetical protein
MSAEPSCSPPPAAASGTRDQPLYFRLLTDGDGQADIGKIVLMLGITVLSAFLSVRVQRAAASPDFTVRARQRGAQAVSRACWSVANTAQRAAAAADRAYLAASGQ